MRWVVCTIIVAGVIWWATSYSDSAYDDVLIEYVPHVHQKSDFCGEACAEMVLRYLGQELTQNDVFDRSGVIPVLGRGCYTAELKKALDFIGFQVGATWYRFDETAAAERVQSTSGLFWDTTRKATKLSTMNRRRRTVPISE